MQSTEQEPIDNGAAEGTETSEQPSKKIEELETQLKEKDAKYLYLYADFENFKKRQLKERSDFIKFGWENVARDLLQVLDNLERAMEHTPPTTDKNLVQGLMMVIQQFKSTLQRQGVEEIQAVGKPFDPNLEEAISQEASDQPEGNVISEHVKGYTLHGRLLRPARVVVSSGPGDKV